MDNNPSGQDLPPLGRKIDRETLDERNFQVILNQIHDNNRSYQMRAIESLGRIGDTRATEPLLKLLKTADTEIAYVIVNALGKLQDPVAVGPLVGYLDHEDRWLRQGTARALGEIGDIRAVGALIRHLPDKKDKVRIEIVQSIGKLGNDKVIADLEQFITDEDDPEVRHAARRAIQMIRGD